MANAMPKTKANNEPYRKVKITMWDDPKFRALSPLPPSGQSLFIYLLTSPLTGIIPGLFKAGRAAMAEELGWEIEDFDLALGEVIELGMVKSDIKARVFWLPNAAKHNPPNSINVIKSWARAFSFIPDCPLKWEAWESLRAACYGVSKALGMAFDKALPLPKDKPKDEANALSSGIQITDNSKQILKHKNTMVHGEKHTTNQPDDHPPAEHAKASRSAGRQDYPEEFECAWREYPQRAGANPKKSAFNAWNARRREGVAPEAMLEGVRRYTRHLQATGKLGTEFVQRASTFFGPDRNFDDPWHLPAGRQTADVNRIPEPDNTIPPGFRG